MSNDKERDELAEIFDELTRDDANELNKLDGDLSSAFDGQDEDRRNNLNNPDDDAFSADTSGAAYDTGFDPRLELDGNVAVPGFDDPMALDMFDDSLEEAEIPDVGTNWAAIVFGLLALVASGLLLFDLYRNVEEQASYDSLVNNLVLIERSVSDVGNTAARAFEGDANAFVKLSELRDDLGKSLEQYQVLTDAHINSGYAVPPNFDTGVRGARDQWSALGTRMEQFINSEQGLAAIRTQLSTLTDETKGLLLQSESLTERLVAENTPFDLLNATIRQRYLIRRMVGNTERFIGGEQGWQDAVRQFEYDALILGLVNTEVRKFAGDRPLPEMNRIDALYQQLVADADDILANTGDYVDASTLKDQIDQNSSQLEQITDPLLFNLSNSDEMRGKDNTWRSVLGALMALGIIGLILSVVRHQRKREVVTSTRTKRSEDAVIKLLDEMGDLAQGDLTVEAQVTNEITGAIADSVNFAIGEMRILVSGIKSASTEMAATTGDSEALIAQLLTSNDVQSEEIQNAAQEVEKMSVTMEKMSHSAMESSENARVSAQSAKKGAEAVRNTIVGMNNTRNQIQDTSKRLKRLGESSQQINEIVNLIQDVTEQTNVLSLNASIQAAMAGEAGRGFAVVAEEVQRLADRSARASSEITELVKNIQQDANNAIASMEATTTEVVSGATMADEAGQALDEIEQISQRLLETIENVASKATEESAVAKTVTERMNTLKSATEQSDLSVSQVAAALGQIRNTVGKLDQSVSGFRLPD